MTFTEELEAEVKKIFREQWTRKDGAEVPSPEDLTLGNEGVNLDAVVLYADLDGSTAMVDSKTPEFSAEIYKAYLRCCARIIKKHGGVITAYDGDRVMAVFIGNSKNTNAAKCALRINYAVQKIINPALKAQYPQSTFEVKQVVGVDASPLMATRTGVRGDNDLVWVGRAANYAAKLTSESSHPSWVTSAVYDAMAEEAKTSNGKPMWERRTWTKMNNAIIYSSTWWWKPPD